MRDKASLFILAAGLSLALGHMALAADLPVAPPVYAAPPVFPYAPIYNWSSCYIGGNIGGARGNIEATDVNTGATVSPNNGGFAGGGQFGCDYRSGGTGPWVIGFRNMIDATSLTKSAAFLDPVVGFTGTANPHINWFDTLTVRGGYLLTPNVLLYAQGGAAWMQWNVKFINASGVQAGEVSDNYQTGWTAGAGVEWMFVPHWSVFLEYNYLGFGTRSATFTTCGAAVCANISAKTDIQDALVGVNYRF